ncbi:MAG TPA: hypothetical protein VL549_05910 [Gemmatimonadales bacterium]|jgi:hypothetical protein|nr:hypothetical protein [Gemmatimonadales bacterium]
MARTTLLPLALVVVAACGDIALPAPAFDNRVDTLTLYALDGTAVYLPSAYDLEFRQVVRTDQATGFDFIFNIDSAGRAVLLPLGALKLGNLSGIQLTTQKFDSIAIAPTSGYKLDSAVVVDSGSVALVHSRPLTCSFQLSTTYYAKLHILSIDTTSAAGGRSMRFEILTDVNCGYRGLQPGLPRH